MHSPDSSPCVLVLECCLSSLVAAVDYLLSNAFKECVICTNGEITLHQDDGNSGVQTTVLQAGEYAVNPKGVWHTADCSASCTVIFITPGRGTQHKPRETTK